MVRPHQLHYLQHRQLQVTSCEVYDIIPQWCSMEQLLHYVDWSVYNIVNTLKHLYVNLPTMRQRKTDNGKILLAYNQRRRPIGIPQGYLRLHRATPRAQSCGKRVVSHQILSTYIFSGTSILDLEPSLYFACSWEMMKGIQAAEQSFFCKHKMYSIGSWDQVIIYHEVKQSSNQ